MKILFFCDLHLTEKKPCNRLDDYSETVLNKISNLATYAHENGVEKVIMGGDIFHSVEVSNDYQNKIISVFKQFPCPVYTVIGNHEVPYKNPELIKRSPLGVLFNSGVLHHLKYLTTLDGATITGLDYFPQKALMIPACVGSGWNILVAHSFFEQGHKESLSKSDVESFDVVLLGHDHNSYPATTFGKTTVIRPGALSRGMLSEQEFRRVPVALILDTATREITSIVVPHEEADKVFLKEVMEERKANRGIEDFVTALTEDKVDKTLSLTSVVSSLTQEDDVKDRVLEIYRNLGLT